MNDRFKFRVWDTKSNCYIDDSETELLLQNNGILLFGNWCGDAYYAGGNYTTEQCTGLKDKNGNLIYEGDIVEITIFGSVGPNSGYVDSDEIYKGNVIWVRDCFLVKTDNTDMILFPHSEDCTEIIGNIHEQAEQKEQK